jgi:hypothetical protein
MTDMIELMDDRALAERTVGRALKALEIATRTLEDAVDAWQALEDGAGEKQVVAEIKALNGAFLFAMKMQEAARAAGSDRFGAAGAGVLDLDAARDEIGLRLACLRAAGGGGAVPGEPE